MTSPSSSTPLFGRIVTAMVTPFDATGALDLVNAARLADHLVNTGSDGVLVCGTTGESPTLSWQEQDELLREVKAAVGGRAMVLAGTGSNCTEEAVAASRRALALGADGALLVVPYYNKPPQAGLEVHFRTVAEAVPDLPLMLYNIPGRTGCSLLPETVGRLLNCSNVRAFKAASGTVEEVTNLRAACGPSLAIYSGDDTLTLPMLSLGAVGVVSVVSHLEGLRLRSMIRSHLAGEAAAALAQHDQLLPLMRALFLQPNPIPVKAALELRGWPVGAPRLPLVAADASLKAHLHDLLTQSPQAASTPAAQTLSP